MHNLLYILLPTKDNAKNDSDGNVDDDLIGATIKVNSGKFQGLTGIVNELRRYRHVQLDLSLSIAYVKISLLDILSYDKNAVHHNKSKAVTSNGTAEELTKKYMGARVRTKELPEGEDDEEELLPHPPESVEGTVIKVIIGDWYITDNPEITNAYKADKFDIITYPPGWKPPKKKKDEFIGMCGVIPAPADAKDDNADKKEEGAKKEKIKQSGSIVEEEKAKAEEESAAATATTTASSRRDSANSNNNNETEEEADQRSLIGAFIRIKKGRFCGLTGNIKEKQDIRRVQLDCVPTPLEFDDFNVIQYASNDIGTSSESYGGGENNHAANDNQFAKKYQKYMGARVRVISPPEFAGLEGKVIRVIVLGNWYITDNPEIPMAFAKHKFDILRYASDAEEVHDSEEEKSRGSEWCRG